MYNTAIDALRRAARAGSPLLAALLALPLLVDPAAADEDDDLAPHAEAVTKLVMERNIEITYDYVATLMRLPNAFGEGAACGSDHLRRHHQGRGGTARPAHHLSR
jgi:DNA-directed RNA polymerase specialized sigma24 family protein